MTDQLHHASTLVTHGYQYAVEIRKAASTGWIATVHDDIGRLVWQSATPLPLQLARNRCGAEARQHAARRDGR